jgi:hypothetical protein
MRKAYTTVNSGPTIYYWARSKKFFYPLVFLFFLLLITLPSLAQNLKLIKGKVTNDEREPLSSVSVAVKGTTNGTSTDAAGRYQINVAPGGTLVFSFVGSPSTGVMILCLLVSVLGSIC